MGGMALFEKYWGNRGWDWGKWYFYDKNWGNRGWDGGVLGVVL